MAANINDLRGCAFMWHHLGVCSHRQEAPVFIATAEQTGSARPGGDAPFAVHRLFFVPDSDGCSVVSRTPRVEESSIRGRAVGIDDVSEPGSAQVSWCLLPYRLQEITATFGRPYNCLLSPVGMHLRESGGMPGAVEPPWTP